MPSRDFTQLLQVYETELLDDVMPWWMDGPAVDREYGGILQSLADGGTLLGEDKSMWSQCRALYTWSALYNLIGQRHEWLDVAGNVFEFLLPIGLSADWYWPHWVHRDGSVKVGAENIYSDGFAIMGATEFAKATGDERAVEMAVQTYHTVQERLAVPGSYKCAPLTPPEGAKSHGISMIFANVFHDLGTFLADVDVLRSAHEHALQVMDVFRRPDRKLVLECVAMDGSELDADVGHYVCPGHAIEAMWFMLHIFRDRREPNRIEQAVECLRWHMEACWDDEYGGMFNTLDSDGNVPEPDSGKALWPHTEALYALLLAYELTGEYWCLDWYDRVHEWSFAHFPVREYGEWRSGVQRDGSASPEPETPSPNRVKDPFHLPRALMLCIDVLQRLAAP